MQKSCNHGLRDNVARDIFETPACAARTPLGDFATAKRPPHAHCRHRTPPAHTYNGLDCTRHHSDDLSGWEGARHVSLDAVRGYKANSHRLPMVMPAPSSHVHVHV